MQLSLAEWKSLCVGNIGMLSAELNKIDMLPMGDVESLNKWWVETIVPRLKAWATESTIIQQERTRVTAPVAEVVQQAAVEDGAIPVPGANGAAPPVRKGWPKGKARKPRPTAPVTPPAVTM